MPPNKGSTAIIGDYANFGEILPKHSDKASKNFGSNENLPSILAFSRNTTKA